MRVSLLIEGQEGVTWADWCRIARLVEAHGLEGLYRSDHYTSIFRPSAGALDAWTTLAGLAAVTSRIRLGTLVSPVTFRHPSVLARTAVTVDHISRGRVDVGLGLGWYEREHVENGFPFGATADRFALLAEQVAVIARSWTGERFDYNGRFYSLHGQQALPEPYQDPHPRLILGGAVKPQFAALAARYASEVNTLTSLSDELHARRKLLDDACASVGRDPETLMLSVLVTCFLGETRHEGEERMRTFVASGNDDQFSDAVSAVQSSWLVGSLDEVATRLSPLKALGVKRLIIRHMNHVDDEMLALVGARLATEFR